MRKQVVLGLFLTLLTAGLALGQDFEFLPGTTYDNEVPTLKQVVGHDWAQKISSYPEIVRYIEALASASDNVHIETYGKSWEGRALYYLVIGSKSNLERLDEIKQQRRKLRDPRITTRDEVDEIIESIPSITWLAYGVHGDEISSCDAALFMAYHLVAAKDNELTKSILSNSLVIIDPTQNPDGRQRFINHFRTARGRWPDGSPSSLEHNQPWPGGRMNHYLFDLNRDWVAQTQPETQGKTKAFMQWQPEIYVDLHEMGGNSTYFFPPWAVPVNPNLTDGQRHWIDIIGKNDARWFDDMGFDYFTGEVFDEFYPGYGSTWPLFQGAIGMTYEQASSRGLLYDRDDETLLLYRDGVQHHFIASLATAETGAKHRKELLRYVYEHRATGLAEGSKETVKEYILPPGVDPNRTAKLAALLMAQGIEVHRADKPFSNEKVRDFHGGELETKLFEAGSFIVSLAQPDMRIAKTLLDPHTPMEEEFIREQLRRHGLRLRDQIYDVTAWSLPLLFDVEAYTSEEASAGSFKLLMEQPKSTGQLHGNIAKVAYLIPWGSHTAAQALAELLREDVRVHVSDKQFTNDGNKFPRGSLIIKVKDNDKGLRKNLAEIAKRIGVDIFATDTGWVTEGVNFGSGEVHFVKKPKVAMAYDIPTSPYSAGAARFVLEQQYGYPVTVIKTDSIARADLTKFNVLILPSGGGYTRALGTNGVRRIKDWVRDGGTLITIGGATIWLTEKDVGLLATEQKQRTKPKANKSKESDDESEEEKQETFEEAIQPKTEPPSSTPGAIMRVKLDPEHWLSTGYDGDTNVLVNSRNILKLVTLDQGRNVGYFAEADKLLVSGFTWPDVEKMLPTKAFLIHQPLGRGHIIAFTEEPNFRAYTYGLNLLFLNAVFFGPGH